MLAVSRGRMSHQMGGQMWDQVQPQVPAALPRRSAKLWGRSLRQRVQASLWQPLGWAWRRQDLGGRSKHLQRVATNQLQNCQKDQGDQGSLQRLQERTLQRLQEGATQRVPKGDKTKVPEASLSRLPWRHQAKVWTEAHQKPSVDLKQPSSPCLWQPRQWKSWQQRWNLSKSWSWEWRWNRQWSTSNNWSEDWRRRDRRRCLDLFRVTCDIFRALSYIVIINEQVNKKNALFFTCYYLPFPTRFKTQEKFRLRRQMGACSSVNVLKKCEPKKNEHLLL